MATSSKDSNEFVLGSVERALAGISLVPDHEVQHRIVKLAPDIDQIADVAPVDANIMHRGFGRDPNAITERLAKKSSELRWTHLAGSKREFSVPSFSAPTDRPHPNIVWWITEDSG